MTHFYKMSKNQVLEEIKRGKEGHAIHLLDSAEAKFNPKALKALASKVKEIGITPTKKLTAKRLYFQLKKEGYRVNREKLEKDFKTLSLTGNPWLSLLELLGTFYTYSKLKRPRQELREAFMTFDHNRDGVIDVDDMKTVLKNFNHPLADSTPLIRRMLVLTDKERDGEVGFRDFRRIVDYNRFKEVEKRRAVRQNARRYWRKRRFTSLATRKRRRKIKNLVDLMN